MNLKRLANLKPVLFALLAVLYGGMTIGITVFIVHESSKQPPRCPLLTSTSLLASERDRGAASFATQGPNKVCVSFEEVATESARMHGLSNRASMPIDQGMLFVFDRPGEHCIWMKDMRFDLDILWLDADKKIIKVEQNVSPSTYPTTFCPNQNAAYVLEVNAGVAKASGVRMGQQLRL